MFKGDRISDVFYKVAELELLLKKCYAVLAPLHTTLTDPESLCSNRWPGRSTKEGQLLLCDLVDVIADSECKSRETVQNEFCEPKDPSNPLKPV